MSGKKMTEVEYYGDEDFSPSAGWLFRSIVAFAAATSEVKARIAIVHFKDYMNGTRITDRKKAKEQAAADVMKLTGLRFVAKSNGTRFFVTPFERVEIKRNGDMFFGLGNTFHYLIVNKAFLVKAEEEEEQK